MTKKELSQTPLYKTPLIAIYEHDLHQGKLRVEWLANNAKRQVQIITLSHGSMRIDLSHHHHRSLALIAKHTHLLFCTVRKDQPPQGESSWGTFSGHINPDSRVIDTHYRDPHGTVVDGADHRTQLDERMTQVWQAIHHPPEIVGISTPAGQEQIWGHSWEGKPAGFDPHSIQRLRDFIQQGRHVKGKHRHPLVDYLVLNFLKKNYAPLIQGLKRKLLDADGMEEQEQAYLDEKLSHVLLKHTVHPERLNLSVNLYQRLFILLKRGHDAVGSQAIRAIRQEYGEIEQLVRDTPAASIARDRQEWQDRVLDALQKSGDEKNLTLLAQWLLIPEIDALIAKTQNK